MSVNTERNDLTADTTVLELRFDDAYRYLDKCGEAISKLRSLDRAWVPGDVNPQSGVLVNAKRGVRVRFDTARLLVNRLSQGPVSSAHFEPTGRAIGDAAELVSDLIVDVFSIPNTVRVGARVSFLASADSMEDAERFLASSLKSDASAKAQEILKGSLYEATAIVRIEDEETGVRRTIRIQKTAIVDRGDDPIPTGLKGDSGDTAVEIDIDSYTRPASGHFGGLSMFVQNNFIKSRNVAVQMLEWMKTQQR